MSLEVKDERVRAVPLLGRLLSRPELGAIAGTVLIFVFFGITAGDSGLFSAKGIVNFLEVSAQLGILAAAVALLMIAGEFDLSVGSMIGFAGIIIAIPPIIYGWPIWASVTAGLRELRLRRLSQRAYCCPHGAPILHRYAWQPVHAARTYPWCDARHYRAHPGFGPA